MEVDLSPLFAPLTVGPIELRNRFVMPGMQRGWCENGSPVPDLVEYYRRRAEGGTALIITESLAVDHPSATQHAGFGRMNARTVDGWAECAAAVRAEGAHFFLQLWHEGAIREEGGTGPEAAEPTLSPSGLAAPGKPRGRAATLEEVHDIRDAFVRSAVLARDAGASGVEIHACHGYLLDQFLWAGTNVREDGYGGEDIRDRVRLPAEIVAGIREAVGDDLAISIRFSQWKEIDYGARIARTPDELATMLAVLRAAGVDLFHASARRFWLPEWPELDPDLGFAGWVKRLTDAPVAAVGSLGLDIDVMANLLGEEARPTGLTSFHELRRRFDRGDFDLMSVGRSQIGDARWVEKARLGAVSDIRPFTRADLVRGGEFPELITEAH